MGMERRDTGRWIRDRRKAGRATSGSAGDGYASWRDPGPMGLGGTKRLDGTDVDGPRAGGEREQVVQLDG